MMFQWRSQEKVVMILRMIWKPTLLRSKLSRETFKMYDNQSLKISLIFVYTRFWVNSWEIKVLKSFDWSMRNFIAL
jgi:hypothetical protein